MPVPVSPASSGSRLELWLLDPQGVDEAQLRACEAALAADEQQRAQRFLVESARRQFVMARALLRHALSRQAQVAPRDWIFGANPFGKPHVAHPEHARLLSFNVSHTHGLVACVVAPPGVEVGIDVECRARELDFPGLAEQLFSAQERTRLAQLEGESAREYFFAIWTLKEAYTKARGTGLRYPVESVTFELDGASGVRCSDRATPWQFLRLRPTAMHTMAVAVQATHPPECSLTWVSPDGLPRV